MKILSITAGAAGMYCGSCSRDNALAVELLARGHDVTLLPLYTPTNPDETNVSRNRVLFGGISIYLQQSMALFRKTPRFLDRLWDSPAVIGAFASRSLSTDPKLLGDLMISMLEGDRGVLRKEFEKLLEWVADEPVPDVINLPNSLLISLAAPLRAALQRPIVCTLQGEDLFLDGLVEPYRSRAMDLIRRQVGDIDRFIAVSDFYVPVMAKLLAIPESRISVVPLGIRLSGIARQRATCFASGISRESRRKKLKTLDVLSVPAPYDEPKGVFLLEAMACGVPVVQPRRGAFTEIVEKTGGGVLVAPDNPAALGDALFELWQDRAKAAALGERGFHGVRAHYSVAHSADRFLDVCERVL